jgi:hypothetical protein
MTYNGGTGDCGATAAPRPYRHGIGGVLWSSGMPRLGGLMRYPVVMRSARLLLT